MEAQAHVPQVLRYAVGLRASHSVERNTLARPLELEPGGGERKRVGSMPPWFCWSRRYSRGNAAQRGRLNGKR